MATEKKEKIIDASGSMIEKISAICRDLCLMKELEITSDEQLVAMIKAKFADFRLVAGRSNEPLAQSVADCLGIKLLNRTLKDFGNTEIKCQMTENVRGRDIFILESPSDCAIAGAIARPTAIPAIAKAVWIVLFISISPR